MEHEEIFQRACRVIPGGVNSPVRAFNGVGGTPIYVHSGKGKRIATEESKVLVDYCCSWGAMIVGHADDQVVAAISKQAERGTTFGINTEAEVLFAERLCSLVPGLEKVRLVNSGTEAVMTALRVVRGCTGRNGIVKFDGCYHGHCDAMLVKAGSGLLTAGGELSSLGVPPQETYVVPYNDLDAFASLMEEKGREIAAVIVEPVAANMGLVIPKDGFLQGLRKICDEHGALLVFDEVITGFRFCYSTYSSIIGIQPDLFTLGKVIGGGLPLAAVGGRAELMDRLAPTGGIYQAGTLSGNPLAVAAGLKVLDLLKLDRAYPRLAMLGDRLSATVNKAAEEKGAKFRLSNYKGIFTLFAATHEMHCLDDVRKCDTAAYARVFHSVMDAGHYLPPSQFEVGFISEIHQQEDIDKLAEAIIKSFDKE